MTPLLPGASPATLLGAPVLPGGMDLLPGTQAPAILRERPPYDNDAELLKIIKRGKSECFDGRWAFERLWWRNILYVLGRQWIYYDRKSGEWRDKRMAKWMPRP